MPEAVLIALETDSGLRWSEPSDFDDELSIAKPDLQETEFLPKATKPVPHNRDVFVSTRLDYFSEPVSTHFGDFVDEKAEQVFRRIDEQYFAWLYSRVLSLDVDQQDEAVGLLWNITIEAINVGVLSSGMLRRDNWPSRTTGCYRGPEAFVEYQEILGF